MSLPIPDLRTELFRFQLPATGEGVVKRGRFADGTRTRGYLVVRLGERVFVYLNRCPHWMVPLDEMAVDIWDPPDHLVCSAHGATFRVQDGVCDAGPCDGAALTRLDWERDGDEWVVFRDGPRLGGGSP